MIMETVATEALRWVNTGANVLANLILAWFLVRSTRENRRLRSERDGLARAHVGDIVRDSEERTRRES